MRAALGGMPALAKRDGAEAWAYSTASEWDPGSAKSLALDENIEWPAAYAGLHDLEEVIVMVDEVPKRKTRRAPACSAKQTRRRTAGEPN